MTDPKIYKETRHVFNVVFKNREVVLGNQYRFNSYPIYWTTEVIAGKSSLVGAVIFSTPPSILVGGSAICLVYTTASMALTVDVSASMTMVSYTETSASAISNPYDISIVA
jgi:hypothetical protein